jgi:hypothetical protein
MAHIRYIKASFVEPKQLDQKIYLFIKQQISSDPNFVIDPNPETFWEHFSSYLQIMKICIIIGTLGIFLGFVFATKSNWADTIASIGFGLSSFVFIFTILILSLEGRSFADYLKKKKEYFFKMKNTIQHAKSYSEFVLLFYSANHIKT